METKRILKNLNNEQQSAVKETEGYIRVVAGAGSGKTFTMITRLAYMIKSGIQPENILLYVRELLTAI